MEDNIYNPQFVKRLFNRMSATYERMNYITSFGFSIRWRNQFLRSFTPTNNKVEIVDLLTGMGETWKATKKKLPNSNLTALDFSSDMLKYAQQKSKKKYENGITFLQQDVLQNDLPSNHFDFVTCAFGLKTFNAAQLKIFAFETKRILKEDGQFSFIEVSKPNNKILRLLYGFYLGKIIPFFGWLFFADPEEYKMLWKYIVKFENAKNASEIFKDIGLETHFISYFYGCATGFCGQKKKE